MKMATFAILAALLAGSFPAGGADANHELRSVPLIKCPPSDVSDGWCIVRFEPGGLPKDVELYVEATLDTTAQRVLLVIKFSSPHPVPNVVRCGDGNTAGGWCFANLRFDNGTAEVSVSIAGPPGKPRVYTQWMILGSL